MLESAGGLLAVVVLVLVNGFFVAAEYALVTVRRTRIEQLVAERRLGAQALQVAVSRLDSYIAACQLGVTMASLGLGWIGEPALAGILAPALGPLAGHAIGTALIFIIVTTVLIIVGELTPKALVLESPERSALVIAAPLRLFHFVFQPFIWVLNSGGRAFSRLLGIRFDAAEGGTIGAEELLLVVESSGRAGAIAANQQFLLARVLRFDTLTVGAVMVPRTEVVALPVQTTIPEARAVIAEHRHSRYPVYRKDLDDIVGVLHVRDLMVARGEGPVEPLLRATFHVPTQMSVNQLLAEMRRRRSHFAIAVDEYGGTDGIVTLEDVLEEIVGELQDEFEEPERLPQRRPGGLVQLDGLDPVDTLTEVLGIEVPPGPYNTVAGYVLHHTGDIPDAGDVIEIGDFRFRVLEMDDLRIASLEVQPLPSNERPEESQQRSRPSTASQRE